MNKKILFILNIKNTFLGFVAILTLTVILAGLTMPCQKVIAQEAVSEVDKYSTIKSGAIELSTYTPQDMVVRLKSYGGTALDVIGEVTDIVQGPTGFIWVAGKNGLARWDGYQTKIYQHQSVDVTSLSTNSLNDLLIDSQGVLWVASFWGLNRYDAAEDRFERFQYNEDNPRSLTHNSVMALLESKKGELWLTTGGGGISRFNPATKDFDHFKATAGDAKTIASNTVIGIAEDNHGLFWLSIKNTSVDLFDPKKGEVVRRFTHDPDDPSTLSKNHPIGIAKDANGTMWVGTNWGLNRYLGDGKFERYIPNESKNSLISGRIHKILCLPTGEVWLATGNEGIALYNRTTNDFKTFLHGQEGRNIIVRAMYQDESQGIWLGFSPAGVARIDRYASAILNYQNIPGDTNSLSNTDVIALAEDASHNLWVGTRNGLNYLNRTDDTVLRIQDTLNKEGYFSSSVISAILPDGDDLWVGTMGGGLTRFNLKNKKADKFLPEENNPFSLSHQDVWTLKKSADGDVWAGNSEGGVSRFNLDRNDFTRYMFKRKNKPISAPALDFQFDHKGDLWVASDDGLFRLPYKNQNIDKGIHGPRELTQSDAFEIVGHAKNALITLRMPVVLVIVESSKGRMWIGTEGDGLHYWDIATNTGGAYRMRDGLVHNTIEAIVEDDNGDIWVATGGGISRITPSSKYVKNFTTDHGLPSNIFSSTAGIKTYNGEVAFGSAEGLTIVNPAKVFTNRYVAPLVMTGFKLFNQEVLVTPPEIDMAVFEDPSTVDDYNASIKDKERLISDFTLEQSITQTKEIVLNHDQSVVTFEFVLLNYDVPDKNEYAYRLDGFDEDWTYSGSRRTGGYTNLDPGKYVFRVKAANNEGIWLDHELVMKLTILPPWWMTWWAYLLYVVFFLLSVVAFLYNQYAKRHLLEMKISERTKELELKNDELNVAYRIMEDASFSDPLTGLKNRRYFYSAIESDLAKTLRHYYSVGSNEHSHFTDESLIFYLVDIDFFKSVNDTYGHNNGDLILKKIADVLRASCRDSDLVIRWGGEEFLIVARYESRKNASVLADKIRMAVAGIVFELEGQKTIERTCSVGYACFPFDTKSPDAVSLEQTISIADWCLYRSKNNGRNRWTGVKQKNTVIKDGSDFVNRLDEYVEKGMLSIDSCGG